MTRIGGRVDEIFQNQSEMNAAGQGALDHAASADRRIATLQGEVGDISTVLKTDFGSMASELEGIIDRTRQYLEGTDWDGTSRANADAAEAAFRSDIGQALSAAMAGVEKLESTLLAQVTSFHEEVTGTFATIMTGINENYETLGTGAANFANYLEDGDRVAIQFG